MCKPKTKHPANNRCIRAVKCVPLPRNHPLGPRACSGHQEIASNAIPVCFWSCKRQRK